MDRASLRADGTDLAFVELALTDANGVPHARRDRPIAVTLSGPAALQAFGSGNPVTTETFDSTTHTTFDGRALAIVRPTGAGEITLTAAANGCSPVSVALSAS